MPHTLKATLLVSAGKGTSVRVGETLLQGPLTEILKDAKTVDVARLEAATQARVLSQQTGLATITLVDFVLDGTPIKLSPRVIAVYGSGKKLVIGTEFLWHQALEMHEAQRGTAEQRASMERLIGPLDTK